MLKEIFSKDLNILEEYFLKTLEEYVAPSQNNENLQRLLASIKYSFWGSGKRFRPLLCLFTYRMLGGFKGVKESDVYPLCLSVEMIHTYSLIHDDLPCMDNDDLRRGKPTNHKAFGEAIALLAGDALLTEAFGILGHCYAGSPKLLVALLNLLVKCSGMQGMIGGQSIDKDMSEGFITVDEETLALVHEKKTGALMRAAIVGAGMICEVDTKTLRTLERLAYCVGLSFQLADDIRDFTEQGPETVSYVTLWGAEKAHVALQSFTQEALDLSKVWPEKGLQTLLQFNLQRL